MTTCSGPTPPPPREQDASAPPLLSVRGLRVGFPGRRRVGRPASTVWAVRGVDLDVAAGECLGLVGESGSGKSTTSRALMGLAPVADGTIQFDGVDLQSLRPRERRRRRRAMQMVFQDPYASFDPLLTVGESIAEPMYIQGGVPRAKVSARVNDVLELVGLVPRHADRLPREFSGGQRQRLAIARAIVLRPRLLICDEPVSALDVSTQNQIINLLRDLQVAEGLAYLFISHDLAVVRQIADRLSVMYLGEIVESGRTEDLLHEGAHPYTQALRSAVLDPDPAERGRRGRTVLSGELPNPADPPTGCSFHPRCPERMPHCSAVAPARLPVPHGGFATCHLYDDEPSMAKPEATTNG